MAGKLIEKSSMNDAGTHYSQPDLSALFVQRGHLWPPTMGRKT